MRARAGAVRVHRVGLLLRRGGAVLRAAAMGLSAAEAARSLRVGLGRFTSAADVDFAVERAVAVPEPVEA